MEKGHLEERKCLEYYRHFSCFIRPGAVRIASTRYTDQLDLTAWKNTDGSRVFILLNRNDEKQICYLRMEEEEYKFEIPGNAVISGIL